MPLRQREKIQEMSRTIAAAIISAVLLVLSFPQVHWSILAWIGLVPLLLMVEGKSLRAAFGWSYLVGFLFFAGTLGWFVYVTYVGAIVLVAYLALYFALFGLACRYFQDLPILPRTVVTAASWTALEFLRAHLLSGFSWASLAHSQYDNIFLIQIADLTGFYGISFLIVAVNIIIVNSIRSKHGAMLTNAVVISLLVAVFAYGGWRMATFPKYAHEVSVGVVQPNIQQDIKWDRRLQPWIVQKTINLTMPLVREHPEMIVWPETSLPGVVSDVPFLVDTISQTAKGIGIPIVMGAITDVNRNYFNSAYLISDTGEIAARYDKTHLVPFGEYIPLRPILGWLGNMVGLEDFTAGREFTLMPAGRNHVPFGVLICFEDTVGSLRRAYTKAGAQFFVNMTNDAWFKDTKAPYLHLAAAVLEAVANKRALVRSANTGVSGFIDPFGRIIALAEDATHKHTFVNASLVRGVPAVSALTFYTKYADIFTYACFAGILWAVFYVDCRKTRKAHAYQKNSVR